MAETGNYRVITGNGQQMKRKGVCKAVLLELQGLTIVEDYLLIPMKSLDLILGIKWLATLGVTKADWKFLILSFEMGGEQVTLQGDPNLCRSLVSLKTLN